MRSITGFILAGGQSTRMGRDKALLPVGDHHLIEIVVQRLRLHVDQVVVVANQRNVVQLRELLLQPVITDYLPEHGPLMGVYTALMQTETAMNLFIPCDMPWVEGRLVEQLVERCQGDTHIVASWHPTEGPQPFPLVCQARSGRTIGRLLDQRERSLKTLLQQPEAALVSIREMALWRSFTNVNTVNDYARLSHELTHASRR